ncbi:MAG: CPBP family intramembrane metalloprotease [Myxococcota bacterium]|nr:CPBP family intramembrane metalloprotease [Myxococcota bacterium]
MLHLTAQEAVSKKDSRTGELKRIALLYGVLLGTSIIAGFAAMINDDAATITAWVVGIDTVVVAFFFSLSWQRVLSLLSLRSLRLSTALWTLIAFCCLWLFMFIYFYILTAIGMPYLSVSAAFIRDSWPIWSILLINAFLPGVFEELAFRGLILGGLERILTKKEALFVQAMLFSVLHIAPIIFVSHFVIGLILGTICQRTKCIYPSILVHIGWNTQVLYTEMGDVLFYLFS